MNNLMNNRFIELQKVSSRQSWSADKRPHTANAKKLQSYSRKVAYMSLTPEVNQPQRLSTPYIINAPSRVHLPSRDDQIRKLFSSNKVKNPRSEDEPTQDIKNNRFSRYDIRSYTPRSVDSGNSNTQNVVKVSKANQRSSHDRGALRSKMKDYSILAFACHRGGLREQEGKAYLSKAILFDNINDYGKAITFYKKYLSVCKELGNIEGETLCYNSIGVDYYNLAMSGNATTQSTVGLGKTKPNVQLLESSITYHEKHWTLAKDIGKFSALTNLGLAYSALGDHQLASSSHQNALREAIKLSNTHAQSIAIGNLALIGKQKGDMKTAKTCLDKHLKLARDLGNWNAESLACHQLGSIAISEKDYQQANNYYEEARRIAKTNGETGMVKLVNCDIGITHGNMRLSQYMQSVADTIK